MGQSISCVTKYEAEVRTSFGRNVFSRCIVCLLCDCAVSASDLLKDHSFGNDKKVIFCLVSKESLPRKEKFKLSLSASVQVGCSSFSLPVCRIRRCPRSVWVVRRSTFRSARRRWASPSRVARTRSSRCPGSSPSSPTGPRSRPVGSG